MVIDAGGRFMSASRSLFPSMGGSLWNRRWLVLIGIGTGVFVFPVIFARFSLMKDGECPEEQRYIPAQGCVEGRFPDPCGHAGSRANQRNPRREEQFTPSHGEGDSLAGDESGTRQENAREIGLQKVHKKC